jgi:hypothetical protein
VTRAISAATWCGAHGGQPRYHDCNAVVLQRRVVFISTFGRTKPKCPIFSTVANKSHRQKAHCRWLSAARARRRSPPHRRMRREPHRDRKPKTLRPRSCRGSPARAFSQINASVCTCRPFWPEPNLKALLERRLCPPQAFDRRAAFFRLESALARAGGRFGRPARKRRHRGTAN